MISYPSLLLVKPVKETAAETSNPNKINIESKIKSKTDDDNTITERVNIGDTAIVHCTFDNQDQIGAYRTAKVHSLLTYLTSIVDSAWCRY